MAKYRIQYCVLAPWKYTEQEFEKYGTYETHFIHVEDEQEMWSVIYATTWGEMHVQRITEMPVDRDEELRFPTKEYPNGSFLWDEGEIDAHGDFFPDGEFELSVSWDKGSTTATFPNYRTAEVAREVYKNGGYSVEREYPASVGVEFEVPEL